MILHNKNLTYTYTLCTYDKVCDVKEKLDHKLLATINIIASLSLCDSIYTSL